MIETLMLIANILLVLAVVVIAGFKRFYFPEYLKEKGKNLATKEDIGEITKEVESIKHGYSAELESLRAAIGSQLYVHQTRYQNEFQILKDLSEKVIEVRNSALSLRPVIDSINPNETEEERKRKRLERYFDAGRALYQLSETRKPFYPEEIYAGIAKLDKTVWKEVVEYKHGSEKNQSFDHKKYWEKAAENSKEIATIVDEVMGLIRKRIQYWEKFDIAMTHAKSD